MLRLVVLVTAAVLGFASPAFAAKASLFGDLFAGHGHSITSHSSVFGRTRASEHVQITVDLSTQEMTVADDWRTLYTFDVSTGRPGHTTPTGSFKPIRMHQMWYSSKYENAPMPWSIFFYGGYAIHGTTDLRHLGQVASHGCVRLDPDNAKLLYDLVKEVGMKNTRVVLVRS